MSTSLIDAQSLNKRYPATGGDPAVEALVEFSLTVAPGELVILQGPSGCGKTTLLMVFGLLLRPDSGTLHLLEQDPADWDANTRAQFRRRHLGFVFQDAHLIPYLDVERNILAPSVALPVVEGAKQAADLMDTLRISDRAHHTPAQLSAGERQRTALARAVIGQPEIILADEPTGNLDGDNTEIVLDFLRDYTRQDRAAVIASHDERVAAMGDRVVTMKTAVSS